MAARTSTETKKEITRRGDVVVVKVVETTTIHVPGKDPEVKQITKVEEFKGEEGMKRLPEDIRRHLEQASIQNVLGPLNMMATRGNFAEDCLAEHNKYRKAHGVEPLKLSKELNEISEKRAQELASRDEMVSRPDHIYGESLSCLWSADPQHYVEPHEIISRWYKEYKTYKFNEEPGELDAGHFTQMIWANTKEFGMAAAKSDTNKIYVVATYFPPGNFVGQFTKNVPPRNPQEVRFCDTPRPSLSLPGISSLHLSERNATAGSACSSRSVAADDLNQECVRVHNEYRAKHDVPPLRFSQEVANYAQQWANELARRDKMEHRRGGRYGENIYCFKSSNPQVVATASEACSSWYGEIQVHDFNDEPRSLESGHFTQMIWKDTSEVGMGRAKSETGLQIIVANYNPPGNYIGSFKDNVPKPKK